MNTLTLDRNSAKSLHQQIYIQIREKILNGELPVGSKLPSYRFMNRRYAVNNSTVEKAYNLLETNGYIQRRHGSGCYVLPLDRLSFYSDTIMLESYGTGTLPAQSIIDFASSIPPISKENETLFIELITQTAKDSPELLFKCPPTGGLLSLKESICADFELRNINIEPESILITGGCQQGISLIANSIIGSTHTVVVDEPGYSVATNSFQKAGATVIPIPITKDGPDIDTLEDILSKRPVDFYYTSPTFHCPTNISFSAAKRQRILDLASEHSFSIIEDDCLSNLSLNSSPPLLNPEKHDSVIYISSFSKYFAVGIRLGFIVMPKRYRRTISLAKFSNDVATPALLQEALSRFMNTSSYKEHMSSLRSHCAHVHQLMSKEIAKTEYLKEIYPTDDSGIFFWVSIPSEIDSADLWMRLRRKGIFTIPGTACGRYETCGHFLQLNCLGCSDEDIKAGISQIDTEISLMLASNFIYS